MKNKLIRAWIYFIIAMILIFIYFGNPGHKQISTRDEFSLMATGACLAFGFAALASFLRDKRDSGEKRA